ncbi:MAG TPA: ATP-binding protein [Bacillota bacterium]|jgi:anti-sigma regulatory factor (Ser/Thr protein kinase)|nr:ATP-binding protein [Bacillota bacterium]
MSEAKMVLRFPVIGNDFVAAGEASSRIKKVLRQVGENAELIRRICIAAYEAEMNIVIHADKGEIKLTLDEHQVEIVADDEGPGIPDIGLAMQEGYSTASDLAREMGFGAGMGLPNMNRCADDMRIETKIGQGTKVVLRFNTH